MVATCSYLGPKSPFQWKGSCASSRRLNMDRKLELLLSRLWQHGIRSSPCYWQHFTKKKHCAFFGQRKTENLKTTVAVAWAHHLFVGVFSWILIFLIPLKLWSMFLQTKNWSEMVCLKIRYPNNLMSTFALWKYGICLNPPIDWFFMVTMHKKKHGHQFLFKLTIFRYQTPHPTVYNGRGNTGRMCKTVKIKLSSQRCRTWLLSGSWVGLVFLHMSHFCRLDILWYIVGTKHNNTKHLF